MPPVEYGGDFVCRVVKAPWRLNVSRPSDAGPWGPHRVSIRSLALATRPPRNVAGREMPLVEYGGDFVGRVAKACWRLNVSRPHRRRALGRSPGLDTLA